VPTFRSRRCLHPIRSISTVVLCGLLESFANFRGGYRRIWDICENICKQTQNFSTFFIGEVKPSAPCCKTRVLRNPTGYETDTKAKFTAISRHVSSTSLPDVFAGYQRAVVNESGMIITHIGRQNRSEMVDMHGTPCAIPSSNSKSQKLLRKMSQYVFHMDWY
jgi:hypothetical protein